MILQHNPRLNIAYCKATCLQLLLNASWDESSHDEKQATDVDRRIIKGGCPIKHVDDYGNNILHTCCERNHPVVLRTVLEELS